LEVAGVETDVSGAACAATTIMRLHSGTTVRDTTARDTSRRNIEMFM
jgi:hypothetical protein